MPGEARYHISQSQTLVPQLAVDEPTLNPALVQFFEKVWKPILFRETAYGKQEVKVEEESCKREPGGLISSPGTGTILERLSDRCC